MIDFLLRSAFLLTLAWSIAALARGSGATRHMIWLLGICATPVLALLAAMLPSVRLPILPHAATAASAPGAVATGGENTLLLIYLLVATALVLRLLIARVALARMWRAASPPPGASWSAIAAEVGAALGLGRRVPVRLAESPVMPMTWGVLRPVVLLPSEARSWPAEQRRLVLLHELAHVARRDALARVAAALCCAICWFQPAIWYAFARLRIEQEKACDELVLAVGAAPRSYARCLLDVAAALRVPASAAGSLAMARPSALEGRIRAILRPAPRSRRSRALSVSAVVFALAVTGITATLLPVRAARETGATIAAPMQMAERDTSNDENADNPGHVAGAHSIPRDLSNAVSVSDVADRRIPAMRNFQRNSAPPRPPAIEPMPVLPAIPAVPPVPSAPVSAPSPETPPVPLSRNR